MKKTVIDELIESFELIEKSGIKKADIKSVIAHISFFKEKHKQEIIEAYDKGAYDLHSDTHPLADYQEEAEQYYNETYLNKQ